MDTTERLAEVLNELKEHKARLRSRANEVMQMAANATGTEQELLKLVSQSFTEQVDTGLDFQEEVVMIVGAALEEIGAGGEAEAGLEPEDAEQILKVLTTHRGMLDELMLNGTPEARVALQPKLDECLAAITLVEGLTFDEEEGADDDEATN